MPDAYQEDMEAMLDEFRADESGTMLPRRNRPIEPFFFAGELTFAAPARLPKQFNVGAEAAFVMTGIGLGASAITVGAGNVFESFNVRIENTSTGRRLESDEVKAITLVGTIGFPYRYPVPMLFQRTGQITVIIQNLAAGANVVSFALHGYKLYPAARAA
jgi:hypothetical protein